MVEKAIEDVTGTITYKVLAPEQCSLNFDLKLSAAGYEKAVEQRRLKERLLVLVLDLSQYMHLHRDALEIIKRGIIEFLTSMGEAAVDNVIFVMWHDKPYVMPYTGNLE